MVPMDGDLASGRGEQLTGSDTHSQIVCEFARERSAQTKTRSAARTWCASRCTSLKVSYRMTLLSQGCAFWNAYSGASPHAHASSPCLVCLRFLTQEALIDAVLYGFFR